MAIVIFGGLGHVGSWVAHDLLERGEEVVILDMAAAHFENMQINYLYKFKEKLIVDQVDILDSNSIFEKLLKYQNNLEAVIFSVAVIAGPTFQLRPYKNIETNILGFLNVLDVCRILEVNKFINLSSGAVYGNQKNNIDEATPYQATDLYAATKISNELLAIQYASTFDMDIRNARLYFVYGPGRLPSKMHTLYKAMFGALEGLNDIEALGGDQLLDWTHVRDAARGVVNILDADNISGESFNISCGITVKNSDILEFCKKLVNFDVKIKIGPGVFTPRGAPLDISKAKETIGFNPKYTNIESGLIDYKKWIDSVK